MINQGNGKIACVGVMSGTSLDGLDIAYCHFVVENKSIKSFELTACETIPYDVYLREQLSQAFSASAEAYFQLHHTYGAWIGQQVTHFIQKNALAAPEFIASHGHTVFHSPHQGFTAQIGSGAAIAAHSHCHVVCDFRSLDVALGGQGAPLVPMGDIVLFKEYAACLNIGGIANITFKTTNGQVVAYDVCVANMALNECAQLLGYAFDDGGTLARLGNVLPDLLNNLKNLPYFTKPAPKSLGREQYEAWYKPLLSVKLNTHDVLATLTEQIAFTIAQDIRAASLPPNSQLLVTGGGAFNSYLIERINFYLPHTIKLIIPDENLVKFKEALIFALLGLLRWLQLPNTIVQVTGASQATSCGCIYRMNQRE